MLKPLLFSLLLLVSSWSYSQTKVEGYTYVHSPSNRLPFVHIVNQSTKAVFTSDDHGKFTLYGQADDSIRFSYLGFEERTILLKALQENPYIALSETAFTLEGVTVMATEEARPGIQKIDKINLKLLPINNAQDLLSTLNGLFIAQHAGGGKAEQIFLRGFDNDHGTDFAAYIDDIPINLSNHAHGQGYADLHFIIPELVYDGDYYKGPYAAENGNFAVSGAARYKTLPALKENTVKVDVGQYGFRRGLVMLNLLSRQGQNDQRPQNAYIALEGTENKGFFDSPQDFEKLNAFFKYTLSLNERTHLRFSASHFTSSWNASGQIPLRAVQQGTIGWYGAIDDTEGGHTARTNISLNAKTSLGQGQSLRHFAYYSKNDYTLYSNFTFLLNDPINGDMIAQRENRDLLGYLAEYKRKDKLGATELSTALSAGVRQDLLNSSLQNARKREILSTINRDDVRETNYWAFFKEDWKINSKTLLQFGTRWDGFRFQVTGEQATAVGVEQAHRISPKASLFYNPTAHVQLFVKGGYGFHSNYSSAAISEPSIDPLPIARAADIGTEMKLTNKFISSLSLWTSRSDAEYIFVADTGGFENNGPARRYGMDLTLKYRPHPSVWLDWSGNYSKGILLDAPESENSIPSAPRFTSTGSVTYKNDIGLEFMLRYRLMAERPLTEDESVMADAFFLVDASIQYTWRKFQIGATVQNLFDQQWMEAVFYDSSRLSDEPVALEDQHFTPGTPFFLKGSVSYYF